MGRFWLFRTNIKDLEYYHSFTTLKEFEKHCHDFYLLMGLYFLENNIFSEYIVWRLTNGNEFEIIFNIGEKKFIQKFVTSFEECYGFDKPDISFFRGGFFEYCQVTKYAPQSFGKKIYLGAGRRVFPNYGGTYNKILVEDDRDLTKSAIPFYKTASSKIFYPIPGTQKNYDICWICNFTQIKHKGQDFFIQNIGRSKFLKKLKILHIGNKPEVGIGLCKANGVSNIEFGGHVSRQEVNKYLNMSKFGLVTSNEQDGCPRVLTEIMVSGTPLIVREKTRFLDYYKTNGVVVFGENNLREKLEESLSRYRTLREESISNITTKLSMDTICNLNLKLWI